MIVKTGMSLAADEKLRQMVMTERRQV